MNNQKGLAPIAVLVIFAIVAITGVVAYRNQNERQSEDKTAVVTENPSPSVSPTSSTKPVITSKSISPAPKDIAKIASSPSASPANLSCEIKIRGENPSNSGYAPYTVYFFGSDKSPNGGAATQWDFDGDGKWDTNFGYENNNTAYTYQKVGTYNVKLQTRNTTYGETSCSTTITAKAGTVACKVYANKTGVAREFEFAYEAVRAGNIENVDNSKDLVEAAQWDFDGSGSWDTSFDAASKKLKYTFSQAGNYNVRLQVKAQGNITSEVCTKSISVE